MTFLVRIDTVNLRNVFDDCEDLSTTRGGGLAVLNVAQTVQKRLAERQIQAELITGGASQGLLLITAKHANDAESAVRDVLKNDPVLKYVTVLAAAESEDPKLFSQQHSRLKTRIRWEQMQGPSLVYPELAGNHVCEIDKLRPTNGSQSSYTQNRKKFGRSQKTDLLRGLVKSDLIPGFDVVSDLNELACGTEEYGNLKDKIAVLRFDGNGFGALFRECKKREDLGTLSDAIQKQQTDFFRNLLAREADKHQWTTRWCTRDGKKLRIEIFVFGGDEVLFAVPAYLGWEALLAFYDDAGKGKLPGESGASSPISYAGSIVFCHYNAPIHTIRRLASDLVDQAKLDRTGNRAPGNLAHYQVLESFDHLGEPVEDYLRKRYAFVKGQNTRLSVENIRLLHDHMEDIRWTIAKRKLYQLVQERMIAGPPSLSGDALARAVEGLMENKRSANKPVRDKIIDFHNQIGSDAAFLHLLDLWDYINPDTFGDEARGAAK